MLISNTAKGSMCFEEGFKTSKSDQREEKEKEERQCMFYKSVNKFKKQEKCSDS